MSRGLSFFVSCLSMPRHPESTPNAAQPSCFLHASIPFVAFVPQFNVRALDHVERRTKRRAEELHAEARARGGELPPFVPRVLDAMWSQRFQVRKTRMKEGKIYTRCKACVEGAQVLCVLS
jgi:hypothetical protein